jgi:uncharacterized protein
LHISRRESADTGLYQARPNEEGQFGEMAYTVDSPRLITITHTIVPDIYKGQGVGVALVTEAVEDARVDGRKIMPQCPFAASLFRKHPEWSDVLH